jgi:hypothetical protein
MLTRHLPTWSSGRISSALAVAVALVATALLAATHTLTRDAATPQADGARSAGIGLIAPAQAGAESAAYTGYFPAQFTVQASEVEPHPPQF